MKARQAAQLEALVALKRQKAEQDMLSLQAETRRIEAKIAALGLQLQEMDQRSGEEDGQGLARRFGHDRHLIAEMAAQRMRLQEQLAALGAAREALKRVLYSEDRLSGSGRLS